MSQHGMFVFQLCLCVRQDVFVEVSVIVDFGGSGRKNNHERKRQTVPLK